MSFNSRDYWEKRYLAGGSSGLGSVGEHYAFKRDYLLRIIERYAIKSIVDYGCGDGFQIEPVILKERQGQTAPRVQAYYGLDVSPTTIDNCRKHYARFARFRFDVLADFKPASFDLSVSMDVLYHIIDYDEYVQYLNLIFSHSPLTAIYANLEDSIPRSPHILSRDNLKEINQLDFELELLDVKKNPDINVHFYLIKNHSYSKSHL